jgi:hypothetical protein
MPTATQLKTEVLAAPRIPLLEARRMVIRLARTELEKELPRKSHL